MTQDLLLGASPWFLAKIGIIVLLSMYLIFALIVVRQVRLMTDTLTLGQEGFIRLMAYVHMAFAILVLLTAVIIL